MNGDAGGDGSGPAAAPAEAEAAPAKESDQSQPEAKTDAASDGDPEKERFREIRVNESEVTAMDNAVQEGKHVYGITVFLQDTCVLKSARAFLVFKSVDEKGELVKSVPTTEQIEDEEFEFDFSWILVTGE